MASLEDAVRESEGGIALNLATGALAWLAARRLRARPLTQAFFLMLGAGSFGQGLYFGLGAYAAALLGHWGGFGDAALMLLAGAIVAGLVAAVRLTPYGAGVVFPHEQTFARPKEDRLRLMRAMPANLEQILVLYDGPADPVRRLWDWVSENSGILQKIQPSPTPEALKAAGTLTAEYLSGRKRVDGNTRHPRESGGPGSRHTGFPLPRE